MNEHARDVPGLSPPAVMVTIKALACEFPVSSGLPLARWSVRELAAQTCRTGLVATIGASTVWRWLHEDAIRPWQHRCWIFPRDPAFAEKAGRILDLYERTWEGRPLTDEDFVLSADEKTSIQARIRTHPSLPPRPGLPMSVEHEYRRGGAWAYWAAWDVHRAKLFGRCEQHTGMLAFDRLVEQVMNQTPYNEARRVFWIIDNGSAHRGKPCVARLQAKYPRLICVHTPIHASWLNQVEIYFSIIQRKVLTPNDVQSLEDLEARLSAFEKHYEMIAKPFKWEFTRSDLAILLLKLKNAA